jgi:pimeloyl-ACP methyl ester carboxylesterase
MDGMAAGIETALALFLGALTAMAWAIIDWGAWALVVPGRGRPRNPEVPVPPGSELTGWEELTLSAPDRVALAGAWCSHPLADGRTVVLLHGFAEDRSALLGRAWAMTQAGWNVAVLDSRARGQSGGGRCTFGAKEVGDVLSWLDLLRSRVGPCARFSLWGRSMGAAIALGAAEADRSVSALVLEAPYASLRASVAAALRRRHIPAFLARPMLARAARLVGVRLDQPIPEARARGFDRPVLLLAGGDDPIAPRAEIDRLADAFPTHPRVLTIPGARHNDVFDVGGPTLAAEIVAFLETAPHTA